MRKLVLACIVCLTLVTTSHANYFDDAVDFGNAMRAVVHDIPRALGWHNGFPMFAAGTYFATALKLTYKNQLVRDIGEGIYNNLAGIPRGCYEGYCEVSSILNRAGDSISNSNIAAKFINFLNNSIPYEG